MVTTSVSASRMASVISAGVVILATLGSVLTSSSWDTAWNKAFVLRSTNGGSSLTSEGRIAKVVGAEVAIVTDNSGVNTSVSVDSSSASSLFTFVPIIASRRADASGST